MVLSSSVQKLIHFTALVACLTTTFTAVQSTPLEYNPVSTVDNIVLLTPSHPAYGADLTSTENAGYEDRTYQDTSGEDRDLDSSNGSGSSTATVTIPVGVLVVPTLHAIPGATAARAAADNSTITFANKHVGAANASSETGTVNAGVGSERRLETSGTDVQKLEAYFKTSMETSFYDLPMKGSAPTMPWPSSYWPIYEDGINYQWSKNQPSPATKYATAFGLDVQAFTKSVSQATGILSQSSRTPCYSNYQCTSLGDNSACSKRAGEFQGYCIPTWFGICHAWTPASILESEPSCAVTKNGVTFQPLDIKALLTQIYDGASLSTVFTGVRFNGDDNTTPKDQYGRYTDSSRRDLGAGFFHIALSNIMGKFNQAFILDVTGGSQVWNQPVYSYEMLEMTEMTTQQGAQKFFNTNKYPFNSKAMSLVYVQTKVTWMVEALEDGPLVKNGRAASYTQSDTYTYLVELDSSKRILGGEWVGKSMDDHPDFLWFATGQPADSTVTSIGLSYQNVKELLASSLSC
ncbi:Glycoprotein elicitor-like protein [Globisporangium polare]